MVRRLGTLFVLLMVVTFVGGCTWVSVPLAKIGGCCPDYSLGNQVKTYARSWSRDAQYQQEFIDQYFLNYSNCDPYRCDCPTYDYCSSCR